MKKLPKTVILTAIAAIIVVGGCKDSPQNSVKTVPITFKKEGELEIYRMGTDSLLARIDVEIADTEYETQTGLMYRDAMAENQGMFFMFPEEAMHSFYMKNTKIPLDLLFINSGYQIESISENAHPLDEASISSRVPVQYVLEINAGLVGKWGVRQGDSIALQRAN